MATLSKMHQTLNEDGIGKCSVPMWSNGMPAGFCDRDAYGDRPPRQIGGYKGFVPALACPCHGGPKSRVFKDGNEWCAVWPDFINLQESACGFGSTPELARRALGDA